MDNLNLNLLLDNDELSAMQKIFVRKFIKYELHKVKVHDINGILESLISIQCVVPGRVRAIKRTYDSKQSIEETYKYIMMDLIKLNAKYLENDLVIQQVKNILIHGYLKEGFTQRVSFKNDDRISTQYGKNMKAQSLFKAFELLVKNVNLTLKED